MKKLLKAILIELQEIRKLLQEIVIKSEQNIITEITLDGRTVGEAVIKDVDRLIQRNARSNPIKY